MKKLPLLALTLYALFIGTSHAEDYKFVTEEFPPFNFNENDKAAGPMPEVIQAICAEIKKTCSITVLPWRRALEMAESGEATGIFSVVDVPVRREKFFMLAPVFRSAYAFFAPQAEAWTYGGPDSIKGKTIAVYGPSGTSSIAEDIITKAHGGAKMEIEVSNEILLKKMDNGGRYDPSTVGMINQDVGQYMMHKLGIKGLKFVGEAMPISYTAGLSRKSVSEADVKIFEDAIGKLKAFGTTQQIATRYGLRVAE